jgi:hypothetical protein
VKMNTAISMGNIATEKGGWEQIILEGLNEWPCSRSGSSAVRKGLIQLRLPYIFFVC